MEASVHCWNMSFMYEEFGHAEADDESESGKPGEEAQGQQEAAEQFGEDDESQRDAMTDMQRIGEDGFEMTEVLYFFQAVIVAEDKAEDNADRQGCDIEGGVRVGGREELFHV